MFKRKDTNAARIKRHQRVRKNISGTAERPRLNVFRSLNNIYAQIIDDTTGKTLVAASSMACAICSFLAPPSLSFRLLALPSISLTFLKTSSKLEVLLSSSLKLAEFWKLPVFAWVIS